MGRIGALVGVVVIAASVLSGCATADAGYAIRNPDADTTTVNVALLDPGPFATTPDDPGLAGDQGKVVESIRMADFVIAPHQVAEELVKDGGADRSYSGVLAKPWQTPVGWPESAGRLSNYLHSPQVAEAVDHQTLVAGFGMYAYGGKHGEIGWAGNAVMRFVSPEDARRNADALLAAATGDPEGTDPRTVQIPGYPDTRAVIVRDGPQRFLTALTVHGDYVALQGLSGSHTTRVDDPTATLGVPAIAAFLDLQLPLLDTFEPTPFDQLSGLPRDPTALLAHTVPLPTPRVYRYAQLGGNYGPHGALAYELDHAAAAQAYDHAGVTNVVIRATRIYETRDRAGASALAEALAEMAVDDNRTATEGIDGFPAARCFIPRTGKITEERPYYFVAQVNSLVIDVFTNKDLRTAKQLLAAQYLRLPSGAK